LAFQPFGLQLAQRLRDAPMHAGTRRVVQQLVGSLLHQRMLEHIALGFAKRLALQQLGIDELLQALFQLVGRAVPEALDQGLAEAATDGRAQLRHLATEPGAAALHAFEALLHRFAGAGRQRQRIKLAVHLQMSGLVAQRTALEQQLGQLLDVQRHAVGEQVDALREFTRHALAAGQSQQQRVDLVAGEAAQAQGLTASFGQGAWNSGRALSSTNSGRCARPCSTMASTSNVDGSAQCRSSACSSAGAAAAPCSSHCASKACTSRR
jgi:hypothetical protein